MHHCRTQDRWELCPVQCYDEERFQTAVQKDGHTCGVRVCEQPVRQAEGCGERTGGNEEAGPQSGDEAGGGGAHGQFSTPSKDIPVLKIFPRVFYKSCCMAFNRIVMILLFLPVTYSLPHKC